MSARVSGNQGLYMEYSRISKVVTRKATGAVRIGQRMKKTCSDQRRYGYQNGQIETDIVAVRGDIGEDEKCRQLNYCRGTRGDDSGLDSREAKTLDNLARELMLLDKSTGGSQYSPGSQR